MSDPLTSDNARSENPLALDLRSRLNRQRGSFDLAARLTQIACVGPHDRLLDVGCGSGELLAHYGRPALETGRCVALDVSSRSLVQLRARASDLPGLETLCASMDELASSAHPELCDFTHIVSAYALYYSSQPEELLAGLKRRLDPTGRLVVAGPAPGNNSAWFSLLREVGFLLPDEISIVSESFLESVVFPFGLRAFQSMKVEIAENDVRFASPQEVEEYWRSNIYFEDSFTAALRGRMESRFARGDGLVNRKRIALVVLEGPLPE